jgi:hypothetical protein
MVEQPKQQRRVEIRPAIARFRGLSHCLAGTLVLRKECCRLSLYVIARSVAVGIEEPMEDRWNFIAAKMGADASKF